MNKVLISSIICVLAIVALGAFFIAGAGSQPAESERITVAYLPVAHSLPLFVALEEGMFEDAGLDVEVLRIESPTDIINGLVSGQIDAGPPSLAAGITAVIESKNPGALKVYAFTCEGADKKVTEILVRKDSNLSSIAELNGKKLGHIPGIQWQTITKKTLLVNGVDPKNVTLVEVPFSAQIQSLASGSVDAVFTLEPTGTFGEQAGQTKVLEWAFAEKNISDPFCAGVGDVSAKFLKEKPEAAAKFIEVMKKAMKASSESPEKRQYLVKYLQLPQGIAESMDLPDFIDSSTASTESIAAYQKFADVFYELKVIEKKVDVKNLLVK